jgi:DNA-binding winged helix-turn-helix (wHTH) protein
LEPKAIELLLFLAGTRGRLVTKAEIQDVDAKEARYIETVPTRGYRALPGGIGSWS